jgi:hypothetical protein
MERAGRSASARRFKRSSEKVFRNRRDQGTVANFSATVPGQSGGFLCERCIEAYGVSELTLHSRRAAGTAYRAASNVLAWRNWFRCQPLEAMRHWADAAR